MRDLCEELASDLVSRANAEDDVQARDRFEEAASELLSLAKASVT